MGIFSSAWAFIRGIPTGTAENPLSDTNGHTGEYMDYDPVSTGSGYPHATEQNILSVAHGVRRGIPDYKNVAVSDHVDLGMTNRVLVNPVDVGKGLA